MAQAQARNAEVHETPDDGLTPGERAYMESGGNIEGLQKEGVQVEQPESDAAAAPEQAAVATPAAEQDEDGEPDLDPNTGKPRKRGGWISKKAFDAERAERKRLSDELGTTKEQWARLEERLRIFQEAMAPAAEQEEAEPELPDPEQDIFGFVKGYKERSERQLAELRQQLGYVSQAGQAQNEAAQLINVYANDARRFSSTEEGRDFANAYQFLIASRDAELQAAGYSDPVERQQLIQADEQAVVRRALANRSSPAQTVYALARARGYQTPAAGAHAASGNGRAAAAPAKSSAADEIARVQRGQEAAMSLSNAGGNRPNNLTVMDLVNMPEAEFREFARKNPQLLEQMAGK